MARSKDKVAQEPEHTCGECHEGENDYKFLNLSLEGKPTLKKCKYSPERKRLLSEKACNKFH